MMAVEVCVFFKDLSRCLFFFFSLKVWDYSTGQLMYQSGVLTSKFLYILSHGKKIPKQQYKIIIEVFSWFSENNSGKLGSSKHIIL